MPGLSQAEKKGRLSRVSSKDFLLNLVKADPQVVPVLSDRTHDLYGVGIDAVSALDCWAMRYRDSTEWASIACQRLASDFTPGGDLVKDRSPITSTFPMATRRLRECL